MNGKTAAYGVSRLDPVPTEQSFDGITGRPHASGVAMGGEAQQEKRDA